MRIPLLSCVDLSGVYDPQKFYLDNLFVDFNTDSMQSSKKSDLDLDIERTNNSLEVNIYNHVASN